MAKKRRCTIAGITVQCTMHLEDNSSHIAAASSNIQRNGILRWRRARCWNVIKIPWESSWQDEKGELASDEMVDRRASLVGFSLVLWLTCSWKQVGWGTWLGWIVGGTNGGTAQRVFIPSEAVGYFATLFVFRVHHMVWWKQGVVGKIRSCFEHKWTWCCGVTSATN